MPTLGAFLVGALAQSSLLVAGLSVYRIKLAPKMVGSVAAFGAGALLGAAAFDLIPQAESLSGLEVSVWLLVGGGVFVVADRLIERRFDDGGEGGGALGIVVGNINDALPESLIFGIQLASGFPLSAGFVAAVWVSNLPQALPPSADLAASGWSVRRMATLWGAVILIAGVFAGVGYFIASNATGVTGARISAFTAGGLLAMLSTSMIPFAYEKAASNAGIWTIVGFAASLAAA